MVRMSHAKLPAGQDIEVADISVPSYKRMGWAVVDDRPAAETTAAASGRRRAQKETD